MSYDREVLFGRHEIAVSMSIASQAVHSKVAASRYVGLKREENAVDSVDPFFYLGAMSSDREIDQ